MKKIIALALISSFAITGAAMAQVGAASGQAGGSRGGNGGPGGDGGTGASDNNGVKLIRTVRPPARKHLLVDPKFPELCRSGDEMVASVNDCNHYSR